MSDRLAMTDGSRLSKEAPLVVLLEGGLCPTNLRTEARVQAFSADPLGALMTRAAPPLPAHALPLDRALIERVTAARDAGRRTVLATTGAFDQARLIGDDLGIFDDVVEVASASEAELKALIEAEIGEPVEIVPLAEQAGPQSLAQIKAMRPHQWSKNALVFLPALAAHDASGLWAALAAFIAFSLTASSVYVLNDLSDLAADRAHPRKRMRPFAAGTLSVVEGLRLAGGLAAAALAVSVAFLPSAFLGVLLLYYLATFAYSFWLKRKLVIDVIMLASLYTIRIIAGAVASGVLLSPWMLGFSMFIFLALAAVKRQAELTDMLLAGDASRAGRGYVPDDLPVIRSMALAAGYSSVLVLALYISSDDVTVLYSSPELLWLICPILLYWISRMVMNTHRGRMSDDPIVYAATDKVSLGVVLAAAIVIFAASVF